VTEQVAVLEQRLRRGSVVWYERSAWLVFDASPADCVGAYPIRPARLPAQCGELPIEPVAEQLLTRISGPSVISAGASRRILPRGGLTYAGELGGETMCRLSHVLVALTTTAALELKWSSDRRHRKLAREERRAI
jgi:hypothetical protein